MLLPGSEDIQGPAKCGWLSSDFLLNCGEEQMVTASLCTAVLRLSKALRRFISNRSSLDCISSVVLWALQHLVPLFLFHCLCETRVSSASGGDKHITIL